MKDKVHAEECLNRLGFNRCGVNFYPTEIHALKDMNPYNLEDAKENRFGKCEPCSPSCYLRYSKKFAKAIDCKV